MTDEKNKENWFLAKIVFQVIIGETSRSQFDEQYRLIAAANSLLAIEKAKNIGRATEGTFVNVQNEQVNWKFIDISAMHPLDFSTDGSELYAETVEAEDADAHIHTVLQRAKACRESGNFIAQ